ncbi:VWA domain-containing protein [Enterovirga aerilata]|nr:VWA domain-containing protein [Enterovirga sp. DB1703]
MSKRNEPGPGALARQHAPTSSAGEISAFLSDARRLEAIAPERAGRLVFALDATMSRQPTWDLAAEVQAGMFESAAQIGGLAVQLVYYRGFGECRASRWVGDARELKAMMARISVRGGRTQIGRVLAHVRTEASRSPVAALVFVGDAFEEPIDPVCATAGELGLLNTKVFMFHEGGDPAAAGAFAEIARLAGGAAMRFDASAPASLASLLRAVAAYAAGGRAALQRLAQGDREARRLIAAMPQ